MSSVKGWADHYAIAYMLGMYDRQRDLPPRKLSLEEAQYQTTYDAGYEHKPAKEEDRG